MLNRETPGNRTIRLSMEAKIKDFFNAGDMNKVNSYLDFYPHNRERADISLEQAHEIAKKGLVQQITHFRRAA